MIQTIPGVSIGNDQRNDIIVRGGSPAENLILIDGIEIPNINHFGTDGSTSGAIGFINVKFIQETGILTGGFPTTFGDKLSSVIDINFREGSKKKFYSDINLSIAGFGGIFEGPLSEKGSYLFSVRRSYLELIKNSIRLTSVPNYWDFNLKADYEISPKDKITLIGLLGLDKIDFSEESAENNPYGNSQDDQKTFAAGINYKKLFKKGFIQTVLSDSYTDNYIVQIDGQSAFD
ncbi:MAG: TonB-dependent receptor plug domain-containing protein [Ignavibacteria bacterium]|nr:TonB-dependent receptor plug domain-containing protein [Ignavibacteria bacterium]